MNVKFIVNKNAGVGVKAKTISDMETFFRRHLGSFDYIISKDRDDAIRATQTLLKEGADQIVAVGGDGTMNTVVNGFFENGKLINKDACLVVSKVGLGCDYYSSVTMRNKPESWMELAIKNEPRPVDVGLIQFLDGSTPDNYFLNMASVGIVADIVNRKESESKLIPSALRYVLPTIICLFKSKPVPINIVTDDGAFGYNALAITVSKGAFAGRGMRFGLDVALDDEKFEVTVFEMSNPIRMTLKLKSLFTGDYKDVDWVHKIKTSRIEIGAPNPALCEFDGEVYGKTDLVMSIAPEKINVGFPVTA